MQAAGIRIVFGLGLMIAVAGAGGPQVHAKDDARLGDTKPAATAKTGPMVDDPAFAAFQKGEYVKALELARKASAAGEPQAFTLIGQIHAEGLGVARDLGEAAKWYAGGAERGDADSQYALAVLLAEGKGVKHDLKRAANLFEAAAAQGHAAAQHSTGLLYAAGRGRPVDVAKAAQWLEKAAAQNVAQAQYDLGSLYRFGEGIDADEAKAAQLIGRAALAGLADAELEYGLMLYLGKGIAKDEKRGADFVRRAAEKGNAVAQNRIARLYANGLVYKQEPIEAAKWHILAREKGVADLTLDFLVMRLSKDERKAADERVRAWRKQAKLN